MACVLKGKRLSDFKEDIVRICGFRALQIVKQVTHEAEIKTLSLCETSTCSGTYHKDQSLRPFALHDVIRVVEAHLLDENGNPKLSEPPNEGES
jgi:hypothetical protein